MTVAAIIIADPRTAGLRVAALSLLERLIVATHRAGCAPITVISRHPLPEMRRTRALGISFEVVPRMPVVAGPTVVAATDMLVRASDVARVVREHGRLTTSDGRELPLGLVETWPSATAGASEPAIDDALDGLEPVASDGSAVAVESSAAVAGASRAFWGSLKGATDSMLDRFVNRPLGRTVSKLLVRTPVTPNQISVAALLIGLAAAYFLSLGTYGSAIVGALLFQLAAIVDCIDGDVAFAVFKESTLGRWLDISLDQVVHVALFAGIAVGITRAGSDAPVLALTTSTVIGMLIAFAVVVRGMLQPPEHRNPSLATLVDTFENRDFSFALLIMAVLNKLEIFLWCAAFGVHVFWLAALLLQVLSTARRRPVRESA